MFSDDPSVVYMGNSVTYTLLQLAAIMGFNQIVLVGVDHSYPVDMPRSRQSKARRRLIREHARKLFGKTVLWDMTSAAVHAWRWRRREVPAADVRPPPEVWTSRDTKGQTHFDQEYTRGSRFIAPRLQLIERAFRVAERWADDHGVEILNATLGTKLEVFSRVSLESLF